MCQRQPVIGKHLEKVAHAANTPPLVRVDRQAPKCPWTPKANAFGNYLRLEALWVRTKGGGVRPRNTEVAPHPSTRGYSRVVEMRANLALGSS